MVISAVLIRLKDIKCNFHFLRVPYRETILFPLPPHYCMLIMWVGGERTMALAVGRKKHWVFLIKAGISCYKVTLLIITQFLWNTVFKFVSHPWKKRITSVIVCIFNRTICLYFLICMGLICCWPSSVIVAKQELFPSNQKLPTWGVSPSAICTKAKRSILLVRWVRDVWQEVWTSAKPKTQGKVPRMEHAEPH